MYISSKFNKIKYQNKIKLDQNTLLIFFNRLCYPVNAPLRQVLINLNNDLLMILNEHILVFEVYVNNKLSTSRQCLGDKRAITATDLKFLSQNTVLYQYTYCLTKLIYYLPNDPTDTYVFRLYFKNNPNIFLEKQLLFIPQSREHTFLN